MNQQRLKQLALLSTLLLLGGCFENRRNTDELCLNTPELRCDELNVDDGQCRIPRTNLIWHRLDVLRDPSDVNKIAEYKITQRYQICLEVAAQIQPIDRPMIKRRRFEALVNSGKNLDRLTAELHEYHTPESLYFLWSQNSDKAALREFLQMEGTPKLETSRMQYALATFYTGKNNEKTLKLLNRALELSQDPDTLNLNIIRSLASINHLLKRKERSYIWAMVAKSLDIQTIDEKNIQLLYSFDKNEYKHLDQIADQVSEAITKGHYKRSLIPSRIE